MIFQNLFIKQQTLEGLRAWSGLKKSPKILFSFFYPQKIFCRTSTQQKFESYMCRINHYMVMQINNPLYYQMVENNGLLLEKFQGSFVSLKNEKIILALIPGYRLCLICCLQFEQRVNKHELLGCTFKLFLATESLLKSFGHYKANFC